MRARRAIAAVLAAAAMASGTLALTACGPIVPIEQRGIVTAVAVDRAAPGEFSITAEVIQPVGLPTPGPGGVTSSSGPAVLVRSATASTLATAMRSVQREVYLSLDFSHLQDVVVSEGVARAGLAPLLDHFARSPSLGDAGWLLVARGQPAGEFLRESEAVQPAPGDVLASTLRFVQITSPYRAQRVSDFVERVSIVGDGPSTAGVRVDPSAQGGKVMPYEVTGEALFSRDRLVTWLDGPAALGYLMATGRTQSQHVEAPASSGTVEARLTGEGRRVSVRIVDGRPILSLSLKPELVLEELQNRAGSLSRPDLMDGVRHLFAEQIWTDVALAVRTAQRAGADDFGFGQAVRAADPALWRRIGPTWDKTGFPALSVSLTVAPTLGRIGATRCSATGTC